MTIFNKIKNILKPKIQLSQNIANVNGLISIPNREQYKDNQNVLSLIDKYKEEYIKILHTKNTLLSSTLTSQNLHDNMLMYVDLLLNINLDDKHSITGNREVDILIKSRKLEIYLENIHELSIETITRLIALQEVYEEEIFLNKRKRHRISYEIESLIIVFNIFMTNIYSIRLKYDALKKEFELLNNDEFKSTEEQNILLRKYLNNVYKLVQLVYPNLDINEYHGINGVALLEKSLEVYAYSHKGEISDLNEKLKSIKNSQIKYLKDIEVLELQYRIFDEYGRNLVSDDILLCLYKIKFEILTSNIRDYNKKVITDTTTPRELEFYKRIVLEMVDKIAGNANEYLYPIFGEEFFGYKCSKATEYMLLILEDGQDNIDPERVLNDSFLLSSLLCFVEPQELGIFFNNYKVDRRDLYEPYNLIDVHSKIFSWDFFLPLSTLFKIDNINTKMKCNNNTDSMIPKINIKDIKDDIPGSKRVKSLKSLYFLMFKPKYDFVSYVACDDIGQNDIVEKEFHFPEGLVQINYPTSYDKIFEMGIYDGGFITGLLSDVDDAVVYLPKTLTKFRGNIFDTQSIKSIVLNEGLIELGPLALASQDLTSINIPSSLETISDSALNYDVLETVIFNDYKNNNILNDEEKLFDFLKHFIVVRPTGRCKQVEGVSYSDILSGSTTMYVEAIEVEAFLNLKEFILIDSNGNKVLINCEEYKLIGLIDDVPTSKKTNISSEMFENVVKYYVPEYTRTLFNTIVEGIVIKSTQNTK